MLARQEEHFEQAEAAVSFAEEKQQATIVDDVHENYKEPLFKTVLDTHTRTNCQILFVTMTILALIVTVGSGVSASRGYALVEIQEQAAQLEQENERLKIDIAKLKSPERIKTIAQDQLGMEVPRRTYFSHESK